MFWHDGKPRLAHRIPYLIAFGAWSDMEIMHSCDQRDCCNPLHLIPGTHQQNMSDAAMRNRMPKGERHWNAKLTDEIVLAMRRRSKDGMTMRQIAKEFGHDNGNVCRIINRKIWGHV